MNHNSIKLSFVVATLLLASLSGVFLAPPAASACSESGPTFVVSAELLAQAEDIDHLNAADGPLWTAYESWATDNTGYASWLSEDPLPVLGGARQPAGFAFVSAPRLEEPENSDYAFALEANQTLWGPDPDFTPWIEERAPGLCGPSYVSLPTYLDAILTFDQLSYGFTLSQSSGANLEAELTRLFGEPATLQRDQAVESAIVEEAISDAANRWDLGAFEINWLEVKEAEIEPSPEQMTTDETSEVETEPPSEQPFAIEPNESSFPTGWAAGGALVAFALLGAIFVLRQRGPAHD